MARRMEWRGAGADARVVFGMGMPWGRRLRRSTTFQLSDSYQIWKSLLEYRQRFLQIVTYQIPNRHSPANRTKSYSARSRRGESSSYTEQRLAASGHLKSS